MLLPGTRAMGENEQRQRTALCLVARRTDIGEFHYTDKRKRDRTDQRQGDRTPDYSLYGWWRCTGSAFERTRRLIISTNTEKAIAK